MYVRNELRWNVYAPYVDTDGTKYHNTLDKSLQQKLGITEIPTPRLPDGEEERFYFITETDTFPYISYIKRSDEEIKNIKQRDLKFIREQQVASIKVTTSANNVFDGDEKSQNRMARAIACMNDSDTLSWVLANNSVVIVDRSELKEALRLASIETAKEWIKPYEDMAENV